MPRSDAVPLNPQQPAQPVSQLPQQQQAAFHNCGDRRAAAQPLNQPSAPIAATPDASSTTPTTSTAAQPSSGYGILDYLHSASQGLDTATRVATDWPTLGLVDKLFGKQAQDDTAAAHKQMGAWDLPLSIVGSAVSGGPELKAASAIGEAAAPYLAKLPLTGSGKWLGGVIGSGVVGAPMSGLAEYGHEAGWTPDASAIGKATVAGGALSAGTGMLGGVTGRGGALAAPVSEDALETAAKIEYAPLDEYVFHGPSQIKPALDSVTNTMTQAEQDLAKQTMAKVNNLADTNLATGSDIQVHPTGVRAIFRTAASRRTGNMLRNSKMRLKPSCRGFLRTAISRRARAGLCNSLGRWGVLALRRAGLRRRGTLAMSSSAGRTMLRG